MLAGETILCCAAPGHFRGAQGSIDGVQRVDIGRGRGAERRGDRLPRDEPARLGSPDLLVQRRLSALPSAAENPQSSGHRLGPQRAVALLGGGISRNRNYIDRLENGNWRQV